MATLTLNTVSRTGADLTSAFENAAGAGDEFTNDGRTVLYVKNGATSCDVTFETAKTVDGLAVADLTVTVGANKEFCIGPFPPNIYNDSDGKVQVTYDDESNVTVCALVIA